MSEQTTRLGDFVEITLSVRDLAQSLDYYTRLGFRRTAAPAQPYPVAAVTDGTITLGLHQKEFRSPALTYYGAPIVDLERELEDRGIPVVKLESQGLELSAPSGQRIVLLRQPRIHEPERDGKGPSKCGKFGELAIPVQDRDVSSAFWEKLGYRRLGQHQDPYPWSIYGDGMMVIGLHQTQEFEDVALTFFSVDSARRIAALKQEGIESAFDMGEGDAILQSPDGQLLLVFSGDI